MQINRIKKEDLLAKKKLYNITYSWLQRYTYFEFSKLNLTLRKLLCRTEDSNKPVVFKFITATFEDYKWRYHFILLYKTTYIHEYEIDHAPFSDFCDTVRDKIDAKTVIMSDEEVNWLLIHDPEVEIGCDNYKQLLDL